MKKTPGPSTLSKLSVTNAVHDCAVVHVYEFCLLILQLVVSIEEFEQLIIERCAADCLLSVVYLDSDVTLFEHKWQYAFIIHEDVGHTYRVERTIEMELTVYDIARIYCLEVVVMQYFQIEHASIER